MIRPGRPRAGAPMVGAEKGRTMVSHAGRTRGMSWRGSVVGGLLAAGAAMGLMFWARAAFQVRTLPERVMEWILLFVPLEAFEKGVQQYGSHDKELALYGG